MICNKHFSLHLPVGVPSDMTVIELFKRNIGSNRIILQYFHKKISDIADIASFTSIYSYHQVSFPVSADVEVATGADSSILVEKRSDRKESIPEEVEAGDLEAAKKQKLEEV